MVEPVFVVPYDHRWPSLFALERSRVEAAVGSHVEAIEHVGSTAVPGLYAKPVMDVMVGVRDLQSAGSCIRPLEGIGYSYWAENPNPERMLFVRFADADRTSRTHNLHLRRREDTSGAIESSFGSTSARIPRRPGNTHVSNTP